MRLEIDETKCPLCGKDNHCLNVQYPNKGRNQEYGDVPENNCWCNSSVISFPPGLTNQAPSQLRRQACICQSCAETYIHQ